MPAATLRTESHVVCRWGDGPEQGEGTGEGVVRFSKGNRCTPAQNMGVGDPED